MRGFAIVLVVSSLVAFSDETCAMAADPVRLIFDTDIGNDVDDVLALGMIHALESRGQCQLIAVTITKDHPWAAEFVDAVNTFYGRGDIPIGIARSGITNDEGKFLKLARAQDQGQPWFPHDLDGARAPAATDVLRKVLSQQPDKSVAIVQVGFSTNLARLLASPPDDTCPLSGTDLVNRKVRLLSIMAGHFRPADGAERFLEYNVKMDIASCQQLMQGWPTPMVLSGFEIGIAVPYPAVSIERDYGYVPHHPLAEAYRLYEPPPHNRPTWDLTSVLYAVFPDRGYFDLSPAGGVTVEADGYTRWEARDDGRHRYLRINDLQVARVTEALVQLSSQPPLNRGAAR
jgi:purine nucleosidase